MTEENEYRPPPLDQLEAEIARLRLVYDDIVGRLASDNGHTSLLVTTAMVALPLYANLFREDALRILLVYIAAITLLVLSAVSGLVSIFAYRDLRMGSGRSWSSKLLQWLVLGTSGSKALRHSTAFVGGASAFHTSSIAGVEKGSTPGTSLEAFLSGSDSEAASQLFAYIVFLACLVEMKKRSRQASLWLLLAAAIMVGVSLVWRVAFLPQTT